MPALGTLRLPTYVGAVEQFQYQPRFTRFVVESRRRVGPAFHLDGHYRGWRGRRVTALVVRPVVHASTAAVLWVGNAASTRLTWLEQAKALARRGLTSLLIDPPFSRSGGMALVTGKPRDASVYVQTVVDLRIGIDMLEDTFGVEPGRVCGMGHSFGASIVSILVGVDHRLDCAVIESGSATVTSWLNAFPSAVPPGTDLEAYAQDIASLSPIIFVPHASPAELLIQNGRQDESYPLNETRAFQRAASQPKHVYWYHAGHDLNRTAARDRTRFLVRELLGH